MINDCRIHTDAEALGTFIIRHFDISQSHQDMIDAHFGHRLISLPPHPPRCSHKLLTIIRLSELCEQEQQTHAAEKVTLDLAIVVSHGSWLPRQRALCSVGISWL